MGWKQVGAEDEARGGLLECHEGSKISDIGRPPDRIVCNPDTRADRTDQNTFLPASGWLSKSQQLIEIESYLINRQGRELPQLGQFFELQRRGRPDGYLFLRRLSHPFSTNQPLRAGIGDPSVGLNF